MLTDGPRPQPDMFDDLASTMAVVHNIMIRCLNSIHQQAPHVRAADVPAFLNYALTWCQMLQLHHDGEEEMCFPAVERMAGEPGLMETNVEQHAAFHDGFDAFKTYLEASQKGEVAFDGQRARELIDEFGPSLTQHLHDEVPTLLALRRFGLEKMKDLPKVFEEEAQQNMGKAGMAAGGMLAFMSHDVTFEGGLWKNFPPVPWIILVIIRNTVYWVHSDWWKFAPVDRYGQPQPQYARPEQS
ncbi:hemerythrin HHE cation binding domain-containing protein [Sodiomyces alkalinus F11]|uniref:Hemerythrin HHE cation binding domain-containing protein n=1 Tax=Sodiomyces alkalinus (strain CBS 110278 / VKM F-3762 / F11) TaxID=1314773 RepID=A0A3N2PYH9_SODAK|nr:hemerythrin HHE cation binding domain-containing protein [Sodiomyces alkalinus F11]ROT39593.1 hemerythrin HHE cation binding domain-containing protein [Sodiomyces alkalinus F11]